MMNTHVLTGLKKTMDRYHPISESTWQKLCKLCVIRSLKKHEFLYRAGESVRSFSYVYQGLFRGFVMDEKGNEYNKNFFDAGSFPGSMTALLTSKPSVFTFESIEDSIVVEINFSGYRELMKASEDLKLFQIYYLEKNWLLEKDEREIRIVQESAGQRYQRFLAEYPSLNERLSQYHIASHLGITPTQLSRIRKKA